MTIEQQTTALRDQSWRENETIGATLDRWERERCAAADTIEKMRKALEPFAKLADGYDRMWGIDERVTSGNPQTLVPVAYLYDARAALEAK